MNYNIKLHPEAEKEFKELDKSVQNIILKQFKKLTINPHIGQLLGNVKNLNLTGYYKLYADNKKIRIVYKIENDNLLVLIFGIGKRDNNKVYKNVYDRI